MLAKTFAAQSALGANSVRPSTVPCENNNANKWSRQQKQHRFSSSGKGFQNEVYRRAVVTQ